MKERIAAVTIGLGIAGLGFLESLRQRARAMEAESCLALYRLGDLEDGLYATCPECSGQGGGCIRCFDVGLISHRCEDE